MNETPRIEAWLYHTLTGDAALNSLIAGRVYAYRVPEAAQFPLIIFSLLSGGTDVPGVGINRTMTRPRYIVKAVCRDALNADVVTIVDRIDELVGKAVRQLRDGFVYSARREQMISFTEPAGDAGTQFRHLGGLYRIDCYPA